MKPEIKDKWVAALRSGRYKQTNHVLQSEGGFCCLGVLCDLHSKATGIAWEAGEVRPKDMSYLGSACFLPRRVVVWADVDHAGSLPSGLSLAVFNDEGVPFSIIANIIEEEL